MCQKYGFFIRIIMVWETIFLTCGRYVVGNKDGIMAIVCEEGEAYFAK